jgi:hypothetical protein
MGLDLRAERLRNIIQTLYFFLWSTHLYIEDITDNSQGETGRGKIQKSGVENEAHVRTREEKTDR